MSFSTRRSTNILTGLGIIQLIAPLLLLLVPPCCAFVSNVDVPNTNVHSIRSQHYFLSATKDSNSELNMNVDDTHTDNDGSGNASESESTSSTIRSNHHHRQHNKNNQAYLYQYAGHWEQLLQQEHQQNVEDLKLRRKTWSKARLEASGMSIFHASAEPDSEVFGEKIVRVFRKMTMTRGSRSGKRNSNGNTGEGSNAWRDKFTRGDVLVMTSTPTAASSFGFSDRSRSRNNRQGNEPSVVPREGLVIDVGADWLTLGVGPTWPAGLWEARKDPGAFVVRLDRAGTSFDMRYHCARLDYTS